MKAYKIKSLLYLSCFIIAAVVYYHIEQNEKFQNGLLTSQTADLHSEDRPSEEEKKDIDKELK